MQNMLYVSGGGANVLPSHWTVTDRSPVILRSSVGLPLPNQMSSVYGTLAQQKLDKSKAWLAWNYIVTF